MANNMKDTNKMVLTQEQVAMLMKLFPVMAPETPETPDAIPFKACDRKNENRLVWLIRQAIEQANEGELLSLCKAWIAMVDKTTPSDDIVRKMACLLPIACLSRKDFTQKEKEGKAPRLMVESTGIVKSSLYTIRRCNYELAREYKKDIECPAEKAVKTKNGTTKVKMTEQEYKQFMEWKKASENKAA